jgi:hypothetical protein
MRRVSLAIVGIAILTTMLLLITCSSRGRLDIIQFLKLNQYETWVGATDLEISFLVLDGDTDERIKGASINILAYGSVSKLDQDKHPTVFKCDQNGEASYLYKQCKCSGSTGGWGPWKRESFYLDLPQWTVEVQAPGYTATGPFCIGDPEYGHWTRGQQRPKMNVVIKLKKE